MIQLVPQLKIMLAIEPVDFRQGIDRLAALCRERFDHDPMSGTLFVFRGRGARQHSSTGKHCHHWSGSDVLTLPKSEGLSPQIGIERSLKGTRARGEGKPLPRYAHVKERPTWSTG